MRLYLQPELQRIHCAMQDVDAGNTWRGIRLGFGIVLLRLHLRLAGGDRDEVTVYDPGRVCFGASVLVVVQYH